MSGDAVAREMLGAAAALLKQGRNIDRLSRPLTISTLVALIAASAFDVASPALLWTLGLATLAGLAEAYFGIRVGFDAALFCRLGRQTAREEPDLAALDAALLRLGLLPASKAGRPLEQRIAGARRLFYGQGAALGVQMALVVLGAVAALLSKA